jgi:hypothetical protein
MLDESRIVEVARRITRQLDLEKGMFFDSESLALLAVLGVNDIIQAKAAEYLRGKCQERNDRSRYTNAASTGSTRREKGEKHSPSPGTIPSESGSEALARAQRTLEKQPKSSTECSKKAKEKPFVRLVVSRSTASGARG